MSAPKRTPGPFALMRGELERARAINKELYEALDEACDTISFIDDNSPEGYAADKVRVWRQLIAKARGE